jgi:RNA polymerase-binding transcription factor DksA
MDGVNTQFNESNEVLTTEEISVLECRLKKSRQELTHEIDEKEKILLQFNQVDLSNQTEIETFMHSWGIALKDLERLSDLILAQRRYLNHIQRALQRIKNGTYGICAMTGRPISKDRLWQLPHTALSEEALHKDESNWENRYAIN